MIEVIQCHHNNNKCEDTRKVIQQQQQQQDLTAEQHLTLHRKNQCQQNFIQLICFRYRRHYLISAARKLSFAARHWTALVFRH